MAGMKVLVIDDDPDVLEFLKTYFETVGGTVLIAKSAADGIKQAVVETPDLILLDIMMPDKNGLDVLKEIIAVDKEAQVAMITAYKDAEKVIEAFRFGAMDCLLKPFNLEYIATKILPKVRIRNR